MARRFANWLKEYIQYTKDSESPTTFHFWTGVSVLAGTLRRRVWLDMRKFQWTPNFYVILVGPPGVAAKSTSISMGMSLLSQVPGVKFGPESMTWQKLARSLQDAIEYMEYTNQDGQKERIAMSCITVQISELGTFLQPDNDQLISFLVRMWDGQRDKFRHETVGSGTVEIDNPWLNFIAATTPAWLRANFPDTMIGGGLTSRLVFVYGDKKRALIPYPDAIIPDAKYKQLRADLVSDLVDISKLSGPYRLSQFAREWGEAWYADLNNSDLRPQHLASERFGSYLARKQTHLHKLALILAAAKRPQLVIEEDDLVEADTIISDNEQDMLRVYDSIGQPLQSDRVTEIVSIVKICGFMSSNGLWARCMTRMSFKDFEDAVKAAVHGKLLEVTSQNGVPGLDVPRPQKGQLSG